MEVSGARMDRGALVFFDNQRVNSVPTEKGCNRQSNQASAHYKYVALSNACRIHCFSKELVHVRLRLVFRCHDRGGVVFQKLMR